MVALGIYRWLISDYFQKGRRLYGLSQDYFWESDTTGYDVVNEEIQKDAKRLNKGKFWKVNLEKYDGNLKNLLYLLTLIQEPISGKTIREVKKIMEFEAAQERIGEVIDRVSTLTSIAALDTIRREYHYSPSETPQELTEEVKDIEEFDILKIFLELMYERLGFGFAVIGFKSIGTNAANYSPSYDVSKNKIIWHIDFDIKVVQKFLEKIRKRGD